MTYKELIRSIKQFNGRDYIAEYDLKLNGEKLTIIIETNFQAHHHNTGSLCLETQTTYKTTYSGGDKWKINYYYNNALTLEKIIHPYSAHYMSKTDLIDTLDYLHYKKIRFTETP